MNIGLASVLGSLLGLVVLVKRNTQVSLHLLPPLPPLKLLEALPVFFMNAVYRSA